MRFVQANYQSGYLPKIQQIYETTIIPKLQETPGCLCACLVNNEQLQEGISITLWDSQEKAEEYEKSGVYSELVGEIVPFLDDSSVWKIQLSENFELEYQPVSEDPVVKSEFTSLAQIDGQLPSHEAQNMYLRILSLVIQPGRMKEFQQIYSQEILPVLQTTKGCRYAFLTESIEKKNEAVSVTIWDSQQDAEHYEQSGVFVKMVEKSKHTLSAMYQWKMALEKKQKKPVVTSDDLKREMYSVVTGRSFT
jgi:heme-degrading monooxygenase HmoA